MKFLKKKGFTIIELLITTAILTVGLISVVSIIITSFTKSVSLSKELTASYLAQEGFEIVRRIRDDTYNVKYNDMSFDAEDTSDPVGTTPKILDIDATFVDDLEYKFEVIYHWKFDSFEWDFDTAVVDKELSGSPNGEIVEVEFPEEDYDKEIEVTVTGHHSGGDEELSGTLHLPKRWDKRLLDENQDVAEGVVQYDSTEFQDTGSYQLYDSGGPVNSYFNHDGDGEPTDFTRKITLNRKTYEYEDGQTGEYILVTVKITWTAKGEDQTYEAETKLFNWY